MIENALSTGVAAGKHGLTLLLKPIKPYVENRRDVIMNIQDAVQKLSGQLPLLQRQQALTAELRQLHQSILKAFISQGRPLSNSEIMQSVSGYSLSEVLEALSAADLVVLNSQRNAVVGAYPMTMEKTVHVIHVAGHSFYAMCALDALSIAPMFDQEVNILSQCAMTHQPLSVHMAGCKILAALPGDDIRVGIRWQPPQGSAAHSMCMEMVFVADAQQAQRWQAEKQAKTSIFSLHDAVEFGAEYFIP